MKQIVSATKVNNFAKIAATLGIKQKEKLKYIIFILLNEII